MIDWWLKLTIEQQVDFLKVLIPTFGVVISTISSILIFSRNKKKEISFKIHEQRKAKYEEYLAIIEKIFSKKIDIKNGKLPFDQKEWLNSQFGLLLYASDKVISKANNLRNTGGSIDETDLLFELGSMILLMRKEIGLDNNDITIRECLSTFINDINDPKYDRLYKNYLKKQRMLYKLTIKIGNFLKNRKKKSNINTEIESGKEY